MATKKSKGTTGPGNQAQLRFNEPACSDKVSEAGLNYFYGTSKTEGLLGDIAAGKDVPKFRPVHILNNSGALAYVAFGDSGLAAPSDATDGFPVLNGERIVLNSGGNTRIRSSATMYAFVAEDDVTE